MAARDSSVDAKQDQERRHLSYKIGQEIAQLSAAASQKLSSTPAGDPRQAVPNFDFTESKTPLKFSGKSEATSGGGLTSPRTYYSIEAETSMKEASSAEAGEKSVTKSESSDFLLVLNDNPDKGDDKVKSVVESWAGSLPAATSIKSRKKTPAPTAPKVSAIDEVVKTVEEIRKSFEADENGENEHSAGSEIKPVSDGENLSPNQEGERERYPRSGIKSSPERPPLPSAGSCRGIRRTPSVREIRGSFENLSVEELSLGRGESPPKTPARTSSFYKPKHLSGAKKRSLERSVSRLSLNSVGSRAGSESRLTEAVSQTLKDRYQRLRTVSPGHTGKSFVPLSRSASHPDLSDPEVPSASSLRHGGVGRPPKPDPKLKTAAKHSRSFLNLVKYGDISQVR